ncbi:MAG TPA: glucosaminidase domain-containing protein [Ktedonobacteraceae bacterium]|nr:glucosaminidase domain-containing protein [Ktedonobacteraceae bacterium]
MASGNYAKRITPQQPETTTVIPRRATRHLEEAATGEDELETERHTQELLPARVREIAIRPSFVIDQFKEHPFHRHRSWLQPLLICVACIVIAGLVLISASMYQRPGQSVIVGTGGLVYPIQVGGSIGNINTWNNSNGPLAPEKPIVHSGPYSVIGKPTITADFINRVLAAYHSPAAGKGQSLYNLGVKYGIDPAFALAFFLHESTFGRYGMATTTLSLGNLRCIPNYPCVNGYAGFSSWEQGFEEWYKLIRNLYVAVWGKTTVAQIIPTYAPASDHNNEAAYISAVEHSIDTWHAGQLMVS